MYRSSERKNVIYLDYSTYQYTEHLTYSVITIGRSYIFKHTVPTIK